MARVTYGWEALKLSIQGILIADTNGLDKFVTDQTNDLVDQSNYLFGEMVKAVKLYVNDDGSCNVIGDIDDDGWTYLIKNLGVQRKYIEMVSVYFMEIAVDYEVEVSKVNLVNEIVVLEAQLRSLIEGSIAKNIPPPPLQDIVEEMLIVGLN